MLLLDRVRETPLGLVESAGSARQKEYLEQWPTWVSSMLANRKGEINSYIEFDEMVNRLELFGLVNTILLLGR